jgi:hypothetical protein
VTALDDRLRRALARLPDPPAEAGRRAERAALEALPAAPRRVGNRWLRAAAAAAAAVVVAGAALAATDHLGVRLGPPPPAERPAPAPAPPGGVVQVPEGARGIALVAGGRLWMGTREGLGVQGLAASAAELSPNARYAAVGIGRSLVAIAPDGRRAWSRPAAGPVVAAAWAPNPIVIAYVARRGASHELHVIEGDGDGDRLVDPDVAPVRPSWRADTQALAYVGRDGAARVAAYPSLATSAVAAPGPPVAAVAYAPRGERLALATAGPGFAVAFRDGAGGGGPWMPLGGAGARLSALAWGAPDVLLAAGDEPPDAGPDRVWSLVDTGGPVGKPAGAAFSPIPVLALAPIGDGDRLAVALRAGGRTQVWEAEAPELGLDDPLRPRRVLARVPAAAPGPAALSVR